MATPRESNDGDYDEEKALEKEINELRLAKKTLFEEARPINEKLEQIALRERECVDKQHQLRAEKHDRDKEKQAVRRSETTKMRKRRVLENEPDTQTVVGSSNKAFHSTGEENCGTY